MLKEKDGTQIKDLDLYFIDSSSDVKHFTIMDRNMWAKQAYTWTNNSDTYGYYYQWWNNYGFTHPLTSTTTTQVLYDTWHSYEYYPSTYSSSTFVMGSTNWQGWTPEQRYNNNLWWWKNDTTFEDWTWTKKDR